MQGPPVHTPPKFKTGEKYQVHEATFYLKVSAKMLTKEKFKQLLNVLSFSCLEKQINALHTAFSDFFFSK